MGSEARKEPWHRKGETRWKIRDQDCKEGQSACRSRDRAFVPLFVKALKAAVLFESRMKPAACAEPWEYSWSYLWRKGMM